MSDAQAQHATANAGAAAATELTDGVTADADAIGCGATLLSTPLLRLVDVTGPLADAQARRAAEDVEALSSGNRDARARYCEVLDELKGLAKRNSTTSGDDRMPSQRERNTPASPAPWRRGRTPREREGAPTRERPERQGCGTVLAPKGPRASPYRPDRRTCASLEGSPREPKGKPMARTSRGSTGEPPSSVGGSGLPHADAFVECQGCMLETSHAPMDLRKSAPLAVRIQF